MKLDYVLGAIASLACLSDAFPAFQQELEARGIPNRSYRPNIPGMVRSPCPGSNTLANHGFINRNGKGITRRAYTAGFLNAFGIDAKITQKLMTGAFDICRINFNNGVACDTIDLSMLHVTHRLEHDASITRDDAATIWNANGDNNSFNQSVWQRSLNSLAPLGAITHLNTQTANTMRLRRVEQSKVESLKFKEVAENSLTEHAYYLSTMNDPTLGNSIYVNPQARLDWVNHWFVHEELPTALGWVKPTAVITNISAIGSLIKAQPTIADPNASTSATVTTTTSAPTSATDTPTTASASSAAPTDPAASSPSSTTDGSVVTTTTTDPASVPTP